MKDWYLLLIIFTLIGCKHTPVSTPRNDTLIISLDPKAKRVNLNALTQEDRSKYQLSIKLGKQGVDYCSQPDSFYQVKAELTNNTKDTLEYIDWTCSYAIWFTNNKRLKVHPPEYCGDICDSNFITSYTVPPHQTKIINLRAYWKNKVQHGTATFRVGMILQRVIKRSDFSYYFEQGNVLSNQTQNLIWSNTIQIP
jgi:hypothetical protein